MNLKPLERARIESIVDKLFLPLVQTQTWLRCCRVLRLGEVVALLEVGEQARVGGLPAEQLACDLC